MTIDDAVERDGDVAVFTFDNPPVNALSQPVRAAFLEAVEALDADPGVRAIVLAGAGRQFVAGADVREFDRPPAEPLLADSTVAARGLRQASRRGLARRDARRRCRDRARLPLSLRGGRSSARISRSEPWPPAGRGRYGAVAAARRMAVGIRAHGLGQADRHRCQHRTRDRRSPDGRRPARGRDCLEPRTCEFEGSAAACLRAARAAIAAQPVRGIPAHAAALRPAASCTTAHRRGPGFRGHVARRRSACPGADAVPRMRRFEGVKGAEVSVLCRAPGEPASRSSRGRWAGPQCSAQARWAPGSPSALRPAASRSR